MRAGSDERGQTPVFDLRIFFQGKSVRAAGGRGEVSPRGREKSAFLPNFAGKFGSFIPRHTPFDTEFCGLSHFRCCQAQCG
ncbi:MAG TPA: hypothetical protein VER76_15215 [Pyrinomonadaceae bacterium]|nr:hypothetical protein [Pyrinomonadaceae bacterium]